MAEQDKRRKQNGSIPDIDRELDRLKNLGIIGRDFLSGVYRDFYEGREAAGKTGTAGNAASGRTAAAGSVSGGRTVSREKPAASDIRYGAPEGAAPEAFAEAGRLNVAYSTGGMEPPKPQEEEKPTEPEEDPMETLNSLIGLETIKRDVRELTDFARIQKLRSDQGLKAVPVSKHLVFTGNPGTGKTTVARILAKLYKQIGVLSKGQLVEVDRSGLVAGYVGQTAIKTQEQITKAMGGVLFIDEAYALARKDDVFGQEAIDTLLKAMEDNREDFVVIVAGYTKPMEAFINSNPGLKSRFNKYIEFPDYTVDELMAIFDLNCKKYDYHVEEDAIRHIREMLVAEKLKNPENFANAREVRNLFERIITNQARRVARLENPAHEDMMLIRMEDLLDEPEIPGEPKEPEKRPEEPEKQEPSAESEEKK